MKFRRFGIFSRKSNRLLAPVDGVMVALLAVMIAAPAEAIEEAQYDVVAKEGNMEIRDYAPQIVAEVSVQGSFQEAGNRAFRPLFNYISGDNKAQGKIEMTAPVSTVKSPQEIAMTAPVSQELKDGKWAVSFMMPAEFTMDTIPVPNNERVTIRQIEPRRAAVVRYSGTWSEKRFQRHLQELDNWLQANDYEVTCEPVWARYNGPFTPWFMRRNEIIVPIREQGERSMGG